MLCIQISILQQSVSDTELELHQAEAQIKLLSQWKQLHSANQWETSFHAEQSRNSDLVQLVQSLHDKVLQLEQNEKDALAEMQLEMHLAAQLEVQLRDKTNALCEAQLAVSQLEKQMREKRNVLAESELAVAQFLRDKRNVVSEAEHSPPVEVQNQHLEEYETAKRQAETWEYKCHVVERQLANQQAAAKAAAKEVNVEVSSAKIQATTTTRSLLEALDLFADISTQVHALICLQILTSRGSSDGPEQLTLKTRAFQSAVHTRIQEFHSSSGQSQQPDEQSLLLSAPAQAQLLGQARGLLQALVDELPGDVPQKAVSPRKIIGDASPPPAEAHKRFWLSHAEAPDPGGWGSNQAGDMFGDMFDYKAWGLAAMAGEYRMAGQMEQAMEDAGKREYTEQFEQELEHKFGRFSPVDPVDPMGTGIPLVSRSPLGKYQGELVFVQPSHHASAAVGTQHAAVRTPRQYNPHAIRPEADATHDFEFRNAFLSALRQSASPPSAASYS